MSVPIVLFTSIVLACAVAIVTSVLVLVLVLWQRDERLRARVAKAVILPWGAIELWRRGGRALPALWAGSLVVYALLRAIAAVSVPYT